MNIGEMVVRFTADVASFTSGAQQVADAVAHVHAEAETHMGGFVSSIKGGLSSLLEFGAHAYQTFLGVQAVIQGVTSVVGGWIQGAIQAAQNQALLNSVLASTHDAVGLSATQINNMVQGLKNLDGVDDDVILSGTNMLLTFTNIGSTVFPQANQAMLDMAVAMNHGSLSGLDLKDTAIQLGKALNDPVQGISALSRVGVTFTDQQKAQIKAMVDAGNTAGAQTLILNELEREFGGAAKAAGDTDPFDRFKLAMGDIGKALGGILLPPLTAVANWITPMANWLLENLNPAWQRLGQLLTPVGQVFQALGNLWTTQIVPALQAIWQVVSTDLQPGLSALWSVIQQLIAPFQHLGTAISGIQIGGLLNALAPLSDLFKHLASDAGLLLQLVVTDGWKSFQATLAQWGPIVQQLAGWFQSQMLPAIMQLVPPIEDLVDTIISTGVPAFFAVRDAVSQVVAALASTLLPIFQVVAPIIVQVAGVVLHLANQALQFLIPKVVQAAHAIGDFASGLANRLQPFIKAVAGAIQQAATVIGAVWNTLWPTMSAVVKFVWDDISGVIKTAWDFITGLFDIAADLLSGKWGQLWDDIKQLGINIWNDIKNWFGGLWNDIGGIWQNLWDSIKGVPLGIWDDVKGGIADALNFVIGLINDFIQGINDVIHGMDMVPGVNIPYVPKIPNVSFASGGIMPQSGLALVGERGSEVVALPGGATVFPHDVVSQLLLFTSLMGGGASAGWSGMQASVMPATQQAGVSASEPQESSPGGTLTQELHVHVYLNGREVAHQVMTEAVAQLRNAGVRA